MTLYDSKALTTKDWQEHKEELIAEGWEFLIQKYGVVYLRRLYVKEKS